MSMIEIPSFEKALEDFTGFLVSRGHPTALVWVFRDDIWLRYRQRMLVRWPVPPGARRLAEKVYAEGRSRGIAGIDAIAQEANLIFATVWFPKFPEDEVQGWSANLKLVIRDPLPAARRVPSVLWPLLRLTPSYKRYQRWEHGIGSRAWAAA